YPRMPSRRWASTPLPYHAAAPAAANATTARTPAGAPCRCRRQGAVVMAAAYRRDGRPGVRGGGSVAGREDDRADAEDGDHQRQAEDAEHDAGDGHAAPAEVAGVGAHVAEGGHRHGGGDPGEDRRDDPPEPEGDAER